MGITDLADCFLRLRMPGWLELVVLMLGVWRVTSILNREEGPWGVFLKWREWLGVLHDADNEPIGVKDDRLVLAKLFECQWCLSVWVGGGVALGWWVWWPGVFVVCLGFALSALTVILYKFI